MDLDTAPSADLDPFSAIMALPGMADDEPEEGAPDPQSAGEQTGDPAPATASGDEPTTTTEDKAAVEPGESSAIELPASFPAELRDRLKGLDPDTQRAIAQWETDRTKGVNQKLEETATLRKQIEPERQRLAQQLDSAISLARNFDPVLAAGLQMKPEDWSKLANEDPAGFVKKKADFDTRMSTLQGAVAERNRMLAEDHKGVVQRETEALMTAIPELKDPVKARAFSADLDSNLREYGFKPEEIAGVVDHRMIKVVRDAMLYRAGEAARKAAAAKAVKPNVPKVVKPGAGDSSNPATARTAALLNRARNSTSSYDQAAAIAALIGE